MTSTNPLNTELSSGVSDIPAFSAGHTEHEWTSWACMEVLFPFLEEQYQHWLTAKNDKNVEDANQAATNETVRKKNNNHFLKNILYVYNVLLFSISV